MLEGYTVGPLEIGDVARTYALVQHLLVAPTLSDWRAATATELQRRKWLVLADRFGVIRGLCYLFVRQAGRERHLEVPVFAAVSLFDEKRIARELLNVAKERAARLDCDVIHFWPAIRMDWSAGMTPTWPEPEQGGLFYDLRSSGTVPT